MNLDLTPRGKQLDQTPTRKQFKLDESDLSKTPKQANRWLAQSKSPFKSSFKDSCQKKSDLKKVRKSYGLAELIDQSMNNKSSYSLNRPTL
jgi:hypothetical protein